MKRISELSHWNHGSKMGHIPHVCGDHSLLALGMRGWGCVAAAAGGGSTILLNWGWRIGIGALAVLLALEANAQPRGTPTRAQQQQGPALPPSGHQTEPVDLNEGKSPAELFQAGCSVCHQSPAGLAKGRREGELTSFLRQHYSSSVQHAGALASFLVSRGGGAAPAVAAPTRQSPVERPPAPVGRRPAEEERKPQDKPQEAARPPEREPASKRKPPAAAARTSPPQQAPAAAAAAAVPVPGPETTAPAPAPEPSTSASSPPAEEKPAAPEIPL
jgi:hypothetical protein